MQPLMTSHSFRYPMQPTQSSEMRRNLIAPLLHSRGFSHSQSIRISKEKKVDQSASNQWSQHPGQCVIRLCVIIDNRQMSTDNALTRDLSEIGKLPARPTNPSIKLAVVIEAIT